MGKSILRRFVLVVFAPITRYGPTNRAYRRGRRDARRMRWCTSYRDAPALLRAYARGFDEARARDLAPMTVRSAPFEQEEEAWE